MEVKGYADAAEWVYGQAASHSTELLTLTQARSVHTAAMQPAWDVDPIQRSVRLVGSASSRAQQERHAPRDAAVRGLAAIHTARPTLQEDRAICRHSCTR